MAEPIIQARDIGVKFAINRRRKLSTRELFIHGFRRQPKGEFWALRDLSFDIAPGDCVGIIGRNGTGKSTLLKVIAGVLMPDEGSVAVHGRVAPLLELRAGFSNDLTGRENIRLVGSLHGMSQRMLDERFDEIVEFSEVGDFIDTPVKHYSSGMRVRLGFALISQLEHPIMLVDEVLAVGDRAFKKKCYDAIEKMLAGGRTMVLVSHNDSDLKRFCNRGLYIKAGRMEVDGTLKEALETYHADSDSDTKKAKAKAAGTAPAKKDGEAKGAAAGNGAKPAGSAAKEDAAKDGAAADDAAKEKERAQGTAG
ncbi:ABC transporter ATP-binding protein [Allonocardiopsis opalescens]|uniref:ABC-2 type transport system ATP-binding protein n=1 Tax=Allonocardiopsis opalescens TaxID=1144618 RepID=A0A2T0QC33_9ACTN|nr:ABC transporter ATP-binding protein [Allonocardiopsis opalescens]PRY01458.1 ABC-2 type transport system ATP-binding protein [Allonocardiopsis opalescens]